MRQAAIHGGNQARKEEKLAGRIAIFSDHNKKSSRLRRTHAPGTSRGYGARRRGGNLAHRTTATKTKPHQHRSGPSLVHHVHDLALQPYAVDQSRGVTSTPMLPPVSLTSCVTLCCNTTLEVTFRPNVERAEPAWTSFQTGSSNCQTTTVVDKGACIALSTYSYA